LQRRLEGFSCLVLYVYTIYYARWHEEGRQREEGATDAYTDMHTHPHTICADCFEMQSSRSAFDAGTVCVCVFLRVCVCVWVCVCVRKCVCVHACVHSWTMCIMRSAGCTKETCLLHTNTCVCSYITQPDSAGLTCACEGGCKCWCGVQTRSEPDFKPRR